MLTLSGSYGFRSDSEMEERDDMISLSAAFSLPFFKGRRQGDMALSMDAMERGTSAEAAQMRREMRSEILTLHDRATRLQKSLELYNNRVIPTAEDAYQSALSGYINNRTSFTALLSYAQAVIRDRIAENEIANELAMTLSAADRYTWVPEERTEAR
jgi:outer membrane protein TolC